MSVAFTITEHLPTLPGLKYSSIKISNLEDSLTQKIAPFREQAVAEVLYHEIGHHIHKVISPEHRKPEDVADEWQEKLWGYYSWKKYRLLVKLTQTKIFRRISNRVIEDVIEKQKKKEALENEKSSS
jgi:hypothetical protein